MKTDDFTLRNYLQEQAIFLVFFAAFLAGAFLATFLAAFFLATVTPPSRFPCGPRADHSDHRRLSIMPCYIKVLAFLEIISRSHRPIRAIRQKNSAADHNPQCAAVGYRGL